MYSTVGKKQSEECVFINSALKYTPTDCFFGDFAHWATIYYSFKTYCNHTECEFSRKRLKDIGKMKSIFN